MKKSDNTFKTIKAKFKNQKKVIIIVSLLIVFIGWAGFTKMGIIPNILNIDILCSGEDEEEAKYLRFPNSGGNSFGGGHTTITKPLIYLYPEEKIDVNIRLEYEGELFADYPDYNYDIKGWNVTAYPDGTIINKTDNKEYSYLFWEGKPADNLVWNIDKGFVVKGSDSKDFLQDILPKMGMAPKEYNEFIVYWYPLMQVNAYNLVHFSGNQYTDMAPLETEPKYDSLLRVFMIVKPLDNKINIEEQKINHFERKGFTVVEWGGTLLK